MGLYLLLIARLTPINVYAHQQLLSGTHKNLQRLVFAQSIQLSNIVLVKTVVGRQSLAVSQNLKPSRFTHPAWCGYGSCSVRGVQTPYCLQPNVRRQTTFIEPINESVVALTPNITLDFTNFAAKHRDPCRARSWRCVRCGGEPWR
jgi:hypothetical protein